MSNILVEAVAVDLFERNQNGEWVTGTFVGRPFHMTYNRAHILVSDAWKKNANGIPQGCFLLAYYDNPMADKSSVEAILLRVIQPTALPTDQAVVSSMIEYFKDDIKTGGNQSQLDEYTRYEFSFSGLECTILGCFYKDKSGDIKFGADVDNFYSAHNYSVIKPSAEYLEYIVNCRQGGTVGNNGDIKIGKVRYSSSQRHEGSEKPVNVYVVPTDFAGKRTALFGMTRTGKSNTVKKIIQAIVGMSEKAPYQMGNSHESQDDILQPFKDGLPKYPIGQIIFDINGEYANPNLQDNGTAIFDLFKEDTVRYSTIKKDGFKVLKVNFYNEVETGFELICSHPNITDDASKYVNAFRNVSLEPPADSNDYSAKARYERKVAIYLCCLHRAGFEVPGGFKVKFSANEEVRKAVDPNIDLKSPLTLDQAATWWERLWSVYESDQVFKDYKIKEHKEWLDDDMKALLTILTRKRTPGAAATDCAGFRILKDITAQHTSEAQKPFDQDILTNLRAGKIVIVDLSLGDEEIQRMFTERITRKIFRDSLNNFTSMKPNNFIQFYFEEAHNLFPKKDDKDLSQIYNRVAKEGAKLHLGLIYATQEVSSISSNILKATQNWFISHLNNEDEIKELKKYYDFSDFTDSLIRFSQDTDKGFVRMKTYSNAFVVPSQIDRFPE